GSGPRRRRGQHEDQDGGGQSHLIFRSRNSKGIFRSWTAVTIDRSIFSTGDGGAGWSSPGLTRISFRCRGWKEIITSATVSFMLQSDTYERVGSAPFRVTLARKGILPMSSTFRVAD